MRYFLTHILLVFTAAVSAQVEYSATKHDFGDMDAFANRVVDITLKNTGNKDVYLLRVDVERNTRYLYSKKKIEPDSSIILRLKVNPVDEGRFKSDVWVFLSSSNEAQIIKLKGNVLETPNNSSGLACPSFDTPVNEQEQMSFDFTVLVQDIDTKEPIHRANVRILKDGRTAFDWKTNRNGKVEKHFPLGYYYFVADAEEYSSEEFAAFINRKNHTLVIELKRTTPLPEEPVVSLPEKDSLEVADNPEPEDKENEPEDFEEIVIDFGDEQGTSAEATDSSKTEEVDEEKEAPAVIDASEFSVNKYKPSNTVLILDVSSSMGLNGKLDLLKSSMLALVDMLRPIDKISIVIFAESSAVLSKPIELTAANKDEIETIIKGLRANGMTNGAKGLKIGYRQAMKAYLDNGHNSLILTTDGTFNKEDRGFEKTIKKGVRKGVVISVLGIKPNDKAIENLESVAELGNGRYIEIQDYQSALQALKEELKTGARID